MAISKKGKRKLVYDDIIYYWYMGDDLDFGFKDIQIISEDKSLILSFRMIDNSEIIIKKDNPENIKALGGKIDFSFDDRSITPKSIVKILEVYKKAIENK